MKFPVAWIREFVDAPEPVASLADRLTAAGLVVDGVEGEGDAAVLDVDVPTNRPDAMNVYGLAREIAAFSGRSLAPYPSGAPEEAAGAPAREAVSVAIEDADLCARYCARVVRGVTVGPSPGWLASRLAAAGLNPVNNVVDVTNYVLWELGHPLHAFDLATIQGRKIVVRRARKGEALQTLDGAGRHLDPEMLVIADAARAVALAGVMGGAPTMISPGSSEVLLESAWFLPASVRRTSKRLGLSTDASYRFERGADPEAARMAIDRAASLLAQVAGGRVAPGCVDVRAGEPSPTRTIHLRTGRIETLCGLPVEPDRVASCLAALGFHARRSGDGFEVGVPSHRPDVQGEPDLVEEVARSIGYDAIPERLPVLPGTAAIHRFAQRRVEAVLRSLRGGGFSEILTVSFVARDHDWILREEGIAAAGVANPMAEGQEVLRSTLLPGLVQAVRHNLNRSARDLRLFESGTIFRLTAGAPAHGDRKHEPAPGVEERLSAALALCGLARPRHWSEPARAATFHDLKGAFEEIACEVGLPLDVGPLEGSHPFDAGAAARILSDGRPVGRLGRLGAAAAAKLGIKADLYLGELDLTAFLSAPETHPTYRPLPRHPSASRDLALVVRRDIAWREIEAAVRGAGGGIVAGVSVFDRFEGKALPPGHVSLAVNVIYQHPDRTLASDEIASVEAAILRSLDERFGIILRR